jgi:hypothetical protein
MTVLTDTQVAENLRTAEVSGDTDAMIEWENEICARLDIPLNETEQGLTAHAAALIAKFCRDNNVT